MFRSGRFMPCLALAACLDPGGPPTDLCVQDDILEVERAPEIFRRLDAPRLERVFARGPQADGLVSFTSTPTVSLLPSLAPSAALYACVDDMPRPLTVTASSSGRMYLSTEFEPFLKRMKRLILRTSRGDRVWRTQYRMRPKTIPVVWEARTLEKKGDLSNALRILDQAAQDPDPWTAYWAASWAGWLAYKTGDYRQAIDRWQRLARSPLGAAYPDQIGRVLRLSARAMRALGQYEEAYALLEQSSTWAARGQDVEGTWNAIYEHVLLDRDSGGYASLAERLNEIISKAEVYGSRRFFEYASQQALLLAGTGRYGEALSKLEDLASEKRAARRGSAYWANLAWVRWGAMQQGLLEEDIDAIRVLHSKALGKNRRRGMRIDIANQEAQLAWLDLHRGHIEAAADRLEKLRVLDLTAFGRRRWFIPLLEVRLDLARGRPQDAADKLAVIEAEMAPHAHMETEVLCTVRMLRARVEQARGNPKATRVAFEAALDSVERLRRRRAVPQSQAFFHYERRSLFEAYARFLVDAGQTYEALWVLNQSRAAVLESLSRRSRAAQHSELWRTFHQARVSWEEAVYRGCANKVQPASIRACQGEIAQRQADMKRARTAFYRAANVPEVDSRTRLPIERLRVALGLKTGVLLVSGVNETQVSILVTAQRIASYRGAAPLAHWASALRGLEHLYVVPGDHPKAFDPFMARDEAGTPWPAILPMTLLPHLDLLRRSHTIKTEAPMIVVDPGGTLPHALSEGHALLKRFPHARLLSGLDARRERMLSGWRHASWVHFAGHARMKHQDPWSTELILNEEARLTLMDVLRTPTTARLVVLNGCTTGAQFHPGGGGLPAAVVQLGAQAVLATVQPQKDGVATDFILSFYRHGGLQAPAQAFRSAVREAETRKDPSWRLFRLWGMVHSPSAR